MRYVSTRGQVEPKSFEDILLAGLAPDGGLYMPESYPQFSTDQIAGFASMPYQELATEIMHPFVAECFSKEELREMVDAAYAGFWNSSVAPLRQIGHQEFVMELFYGPTLAFKDFALQLLGKLFDGVLARKKQRVVIVGATSGDTGSAAIYGCKDCANVEMFILHPKGRVSDVQRRQMTTVDSPNVHNIALEGNFDDCQNLVKDLFNAPNFLPNGVNLVAVNSINWARILAQIVYYFYAAVHLGAPACSVSFAVPTGNFGDIFAGYVARKMGLPIEQLVVATNKNDILHRFMEHNAYEKGTLQPSLSPSMDIQISSNFERLLFDVMQNDGARLAKEMEGFKQGAIQLEQGEFESLKRVFSSLSVDDEQTVSIMGQVWQESQVMVDPHTAIGVGAARACRSSQEVPMVVLATAHPAKFPAAVEKAGLGSPELPDFLSHIMIDDERYETLSSDFDKVKDYIVNKI